MKRFSGLRTLFWLLLLALLALALRDIPLADIRQTLQGLGSLELVLLGLFNILIFLLFSSRWWLILHAQGYRLPYFSLAGYRLSAFAISYFTPGTQFGGEPLQVYLLQNRHHIPGSSALAAVMLDKLFEILANFTFLIIGLLLIINGGLFQGLTHAHTVLVISALLSLPLGYLFALWAGRFPLTWLVVKLPARAANLAVLRRAAPLIVSTERQIATLFHHKPLTILWVLFLSGFIWVLLLAEYWLTLRFLGVQLNLSQTIGALTAARIAFLTPLPGGIGALEASQVIALQALGLHPAMGISVSLLIRARDLTLGGIGLWWAAVLSRRHIVEPLPARQEISRNVLWRERS